MYKVPFYIPTYPSKVLSLTKENFYKHIDNAVDVLEKEFLKITGAPYSLSVNNSSLSINLALCSIDLKRGDKVICAVNSYVDVPESIRDFDSEPIFVDIEPHTYHIDLDGVKKAIAKNRSKKLRAIIISHFAGLKQDISEIIDIAKSNNLLIIEDFSDSPAVLDNTTFDGDIAIFSLNYKLDNSLKGAIIVFKNEQFFNRAKLLREHGVINKSKDVSYLYDIVDIGCDYRLDSLNAYLLSGILKDRKEMINKRLEIANFYLKELKDVNHIKLPVVNKEHLYSYFIVEVDKNRDAFAKELKARGVEVALHYVPLNFTTYYKEKYGLKIFNFPNALSAYQKVMSIPCNSKMSLEDAKYVVEAIKEVASEHI